MPCRLMHALVGAVLFTAPAIAQPETWRIDPPHTAAQFAVRHLGISTVRGAFTKAGGPAQYDPADVTKTSLDITIDAAPIDTRVEMRDRRSW